MKRLLILLVVPTVMLFWQPTVSEAGLFSCCSKSKKKSSAAKTPTASPKPSPSASTNVSPRNSTTNRRISEGRKQSARGKQALNASQATRRPSTSRPASTARKISRNKSGSASSMRGTTFKGKQSASAAKTERPSIGRKPEHAAGPSTSRRPASDSGLSDASVVLPRLSPQPGAGANRAERVVREGGKRQRNTRGRRASVKHKVSQGRRRDGGA